MNNLSMSERELQFEVERIAYKYDVLYFHVTDSRYTIGAGFPDLLLSSKKGTVFAELKVDDTSKGFLKPNQKLWRESLEASGEEYYLWRPRHLLNGEIEAIIKELSDV